MALSAVAQRSPAVAHAGLVVCPVPTTMKYTTRSVYAVDVASIRTTVPLL